MAIIIKSSEIPWLPGDLQELRFQTYFPALWMANAMRMAGFSREVQPALLLGSLWPTLVLRVDSLLQSLFGQKQKCILIVKEMNGSPIMLSNICKIRAIIYVIITNAELLNLVYFL